MNFIYLFSEELALERQSLNICVSVVISKYSGLFLETGLPDREHWPMLVPLPRADPSPSGLHQGYRHVERWLYSRWDDIGASPISCSTWAGPASSGYWHNSSGWQWLESGVEHHAKQDAEEPSS